MKCKFVITVAFSTVFLLSAVRAEEGGSGHYMPGMTASFIDALPGKPGLAAVNIFTFYKGSVGAN